MYLKHIDKKKLAYYGGGFAGVILALIIIFGANAVVSVTFVCVLIASVWLVIVYMGYLSVLLIKDSFYLPKHSTMVSRETKRIETIEDKTICGLPLGQGIEIIEAWKEEHPNELYKRKEMPRKLH